MSVFGSGGVINADKGGYLFKQPPKQRVAKNNRMNAAEPLLKPFGFISNLVFNRTELIGIAVIGIYFTTDHLLVTSILNTGNRPSESPPAEQIPDGGFEVGFDEGFGHGNLPVWLNNRT
jgi:hypothetical protein